MNPCTPQAPGLYTYYAIASLLVVILAISLIWIPFVQLVAEMNTVIARVLLYVNKEVIGCGEAGILACLGNFFSSSQALAFISLTCFLFFLYLASGDFLVFAGCYVYNWPDNKYLDKLKRTTLGVIQYLLLFTGKGRYGTFNENTMIQYDHELEQNEET